MCTFSITEQILAPELMCFNSHMPVNAGRSGFIGANWNVYKQPDHNFGFQGKECRFFFSLSILHFFKIVLLETQ